MSRLFDQKRSSRIKSHDFFSDKFYRPIQHITIISSAYYATNAGYAILYVIKSFERPLPWLKLRNENDTVLFPDQVFSYYTDEILEYEKDLDTFSHTKFLWKIFLATFSVWIIVFLCLVSGVKSLGKVVYFLFLYPFSVIIAMFIVAINKEGGFKGIKESFDAGMFIKISYNPTEFNGEELVP